VTPWGSLGSVAEGNGEYECIENVRTMRQFTTGELDPESLASETTLVPNSTRVDLLVDGASEKPGNGSKEDIDVQYGGYEDVHRSGINITNAGSSKLQRQHGRPSSEHAAHVRRSTSIHRSANVDSGLNERRNSHRTPRRAITANSKGNALVSSSKPLTIRTGNFVHNNPGSENHAQIGTVSGSARPRQRTMSHNSAVSAKSSKSSRSFGNKDRTVGPSGALKDRKGRQDRPKAKRRPTRLIGQPMSAIEPRNGRSGSKDSAKGGASEDEGDDSKDGEGKGGAWRIGSLVRMARKLKIGGKESADDKASTGKGTGKGTGRG
jgi:hypothetical protein